MAEDESPAPCHCGHPSAATAFFAAAYLVTSSPYDTQPFLRSAGQFAAFLCIVLVAVCFFASIYWVMYLLITVERRRSARGLCRSCGYSLTGNVSGVCPECGTPVANQDDGVPEREPRPLNYARPGRKRPFVWPPLGCMIGAGLFPVPPVPLVRRRVFHSSLTRWRVKPAVGDVHARPVGPAVPAAA